MTIAVSVKSLSKTFPIDNNNHIKVLSNINVDINMGELTMLVGPSGCGKTTLISVISGILSPTHGEIKIFDESLNKMSDKQKVLLRRKNIGFIFQQYNLLPSLTASENVAIPLIASGIKDKKAISEAKKILEKIGMNGQTEKLPRQLSGGQQQRVAIARALVHNPRIIICDEPTAALDGKTGKAVMEILKDIASDKNRAVLIVTHDNRIYHYSDRIIEMSDGKIVGDYLPQDFINKEHS